MLFNYIDNLTERPFKYFLHKTRERYINHAFQKFIKTHPLDEAAAKDLKLRLDTEVDRIYAIVDKSILRDRLRRAKYTFLITAVVSIIVIAATGGFTAPAVVTFLIPFIAASVAWFASVITIPISYNQRVKGGLDSVLVASEKSAYHPPGCADQSEKNLPQSDMQTHIQTFLALNKDKASQENASATDNTKQALTDERVSLVTTELVKQQKNVKGIYFWRNTADSTVMPESSNKSNNKADLFITFVMENPPAPSPKI